jgi:catechol 2,3-dioxygenase-like lactoylglutathione lyase family enzyme
VSVRVWYRVRDLDAARGFYTQTLGFTESYLDEDGEWAKLERGETEIAIASGDPEDDGGVATVDVADVKAEAARLRDEGVEVGVVLEIHGELRIVDVFDPDGNRIQFAEDVSVSGDATDAAS